MLLEAAVFTLIISLIAGGRIGRLKSVELRAIWLFFLAALGRIAVTALGARGLPLAAHAGGLINIATFLLLLLGLSFNWRYWGMRIAAFGVLLNLLVIAANGGSMPVKRELAVRAGNQVMLRLLDLPIYVTHKPVTPKTRLKPLADVLPLPLFPPRPRFFSPGSIGDVFVTAGACWFIISALGAFGTGRYHSDQSK